MFSVQELIKPGIVYHPRGGGGGGQLGSNYARMCVSKVKDMDPFLASRD